jgi:predicted phosphohydrolase
MSVFVLSDLHLAISTPQKNMEVFGSRWKDYHKRIWSNWQEVVTPNDLILIPGDISWAMDLETVKTDLLWIHELPGQKLIIKGNHDYWWGSINKLLQVLPPSIHVIHNNSFNWNDISFAGTRLWDTPEYLIEGIFEDEENMPRDTQEELDSQEKIYQRELHRLEVSLKALDKNAKTKIALTHYPPIGLDLMPTRASQLLENYGVDICVFGHLHGVKDRYKKLFGQARNVQYILASCDYLQCSPLKIL